MTVNDSLQRRELASQIEIVDEGVLLAQYIVSQSPNKVVLRNFEGVITTYSEPDNYVPGECDLDFLKGDEIVNDGVAKLLRGDQLSMEPAKLARHERNKKQ